MRDLNERLERNKAELLKEMKDNQAKTETAIKTAVDDNFGVLDGRLQGMLKNAERTIAIIMVAAFMVGFTISQIVRLQIERMRSKALVKMATDLELRVVGLQQEALKLTGIVQELKGMDAKYSAQLGLLKPKLRFNIKILLFIIIAFLMGAATIFFAVRS